MPRFKNKNISLFNYLALLQLITALIATIITLLFAKFAEGDLYDFVAGFLPDVSLVTWSIVGLMMLLVQVLGNFAAAAFSLFRSDHAGQLAMALGAAEALWMIFQFFILHMHNMLMLVFFLTALMQLVLGFLVADKVKEANRVV